ncbi:hypothetical protein G6F65_021496 [Rhizopus arrhizus]|nr:hypothetical protein G6F65_021496 [Rhizopus arrhizus]
MLPTGACLGTGRANAPTPPGRGLGSIPLRHLYAGQVKSRDLEVLDLDVGRLVAQIDGRQPGRAEYRAIEPLQDDVLTDRERGAGGGQVVGNLLKPSSGESLFGRR